MFRYYLTMPGAFPRFAANVVSFDDDTVYESRFYIGE
nr:MAG TPA: hypothetical protein [Caudoviricetes sp.]